MIYLFKNDHSWLSNFTECEIIFGGCIYTSVENAYQSAKSNDDGWKIFCTNHSSKEVKLASKNIIIHPNWHVRKLMVMEALLIQKFTKEPFKSLLLETGHQNIIEGNFWNDFFWGVDLTKSPNIGENHLGRLIMDIRSKIKKDSL